MLGLSCTVTGQALAYLAVADDCQLEMRGITVSEKYRGIKSDGIIYRGLAKYRGIPSGGTDYYMLARVLAVVVCLSIRLSHASIVPKRLNEASRK